MKIVVCDDDVTLRGVVSRLAESVGHTVIAETDTAEDAVELISRFGAEGLVLDLSLPWGSGMVAVRALRDLAIAVPDRPVHRLRRRRSPSCATPVCGRSSRSPTSTARARPPRRSVESPTRRAAGRAGASGDASRATRPRVPAPVGRTPSGLEAPDTFAGGRRRVRAGRRRPRRPRRVPSRRTSRRSTASRRRPPPRRRPRPPDAAPRPGPARASTATSSSRSSSTAGGPASSRCGAASKRIHERSQVGGVAVGGLGASTTRSSRRTRRSSRAMTPRDRSIGQPAGRSAVGRLNSTDRRRPLRLRRRAHRGVAVHAARRDRRRGRGPARAGARDACSGRTTRTPTTPSTGWSAASSAASSGSPLAAAALAEVGIELEPAQHDGRVQHPRRARRRRRPHPARCATTATRRRSSRTTSKEASRGRGGRCSTSTPSSTSSSTAPPSACASRTRRSTATPSTCSAASSRSRRCSSTTPRATSPPPAPRDARHPRRPRPACLPSPSSTASCAADVSVRFFERQREQLVGEGIDPDRLPPGQYRDQSFPVLHVGAVPDWSRPHRPGTCASSGTSSGPTGSPSTSCGRCRR